MGGCGGGVLSRGLRRAGTCRCMQHGCTYAGGARPAWRVLLLTSRAPAGCPPYPPCPPTQVITTYQTLAAEANARSGLCRARWLRVVLDEAHTVKNPNTAVRPAPLHSGLPPRGCCTQRPRWSSLTRAPPSVCPQMAKAARSLNAARRWAVTGTPLQNSLRACAGWLGCSAGAGWSRHWSMPALPSGASHQRSYSSSSDLHPPACTHAPCRRRPARHLRLPAPGHAGGPGPVHALHGAAHQGAGARRPQAPAGQQQHWVGGGGVGICGTELCGNGRESGQRSEEQQAVLALGGFGWPGQG